MIPDHYKHFPRKTNSQGREFIITRTDKLESRWINKVERSQWHHFVMFIDDGSETEMFEDFDGKYKRQLTR